MCFNVNGAKRIAWRNIICYKIGFNMGKEIFIPYFMDSYRYQKGLLQPFVQLTTHGNQIHEGYHSYIKQRKDCKGLFVIPRGTGYYRNSKFGEYVSSRIVYVGEITFWNKMKIRLGLWKAPSESTN